MTDVLTQCQAWDTNSDFLVNSERKSCYSLKDGRFEWNFCKNRKSLDGRPFAVAELQNGRISEAFGIVSLYDLMVSGFQMHCAEVCCSFLFLNPQGQAECRFMGAAQGTCDTLLAET